MFYMSLDNVYVCNKMFVGLSVRPSVRLSFNIQCCIQVVLSVRRKHTNVAVTIYITQ